MGRNKKPSGGDAAFEVAFYEKVLHFSPDFVEALIVLAELYTREGRFADGLLLDRRLAALRPDDLVIQYNLACSLSLTGDVAGAFQVIKQAVAAGYGDFAHLEKDTDLAGLRNDPAFQEYYRGLTAQG